MDEGRNETNGCEMMLTRTMSLPDVRETTVLSELLYCRPRAFTQTLYTEPHLSPDTTQKVSVSVPTQEASWPFWLSK